MAVTPLARTATAADLGEVAALYRSLETEMGALRPVWPLVDGLTEPVEDALGAMLSAPEWQVLVGLLDGAIVGFLAGRDEPLLPRSGGGLIGAVRLLFTHPDAREVGVGEALLSRYLEEARRRGIRRFDAHVSPGHRPAKNFLEANGFKARSIVMYREEDG